MSEVRSQKRTRPLRTPTSACTVASRLVAFWACFLACASEGASPVVAIDAGDDVSDGASGDAGPSPHDIGELGAGLSTLVGDSNAGFVDGPRNFSLFYNPVNVAIGYDGNIYVADFDNGLVREVTPAGVTTTLVNQDGFSRPFGLAFAPDGAFYVQTDRNSAGEPTGALWRVALGGGGAVLVRDDIGRARGLASLSDGRLVLADQFENTLKIYDPGLDTLYPLAGQNGVAGFADGTGAAARFREPLDIVIDSSDTIYVADSGNHRIRQVTLAGVVSTLAGNGVGTSLDGTLASASFDTPVGLALGGDESLFVSEFSSGRTRLVRDGEVSTIAGSTQGFADDRNPLEGKLHVCEGLAYDAPYLYLADGSGGSDAAYHRVRRLDVDN